MGIPVEGYQASTVPHCVNESHVMIVDILSVFDFILDSEFVI